MTDKPWIDAQEVDELMARYPSLTRSRVESVLEAYWPMKNDVEEALLALSARQHHDADESLDYTHASQ